MQIQRPDNSRPTEVEVEEVYGPELKTPNGRNIFDDDDRVAKGKVQHR
jgi:hypothetical protein